MKPSLLVLTALAGMVVAGMVVTVCPEAATEGQVPAGPPYGVAFPTEDWGPGAVDAHESSASRQRCSFDGGLSWVHSVCVFTRARFDRSRQYRRQ